LKEIYNIRPRNYNLLVYEADRTDIGEPRTYAWEITDPCSLNPYRILKTSHVDFENLEQAVQNGIGHLFSIELEDQ
jgi:hypothetical protein